MSKSIAIVQTSAVSSAELKALCTELMPDVNEALGVSLGINAFE